MKKRILALIIVLILAFSLFSCSSKDDEGTIVGVWQSPPLAGHSEGFTYELTEDGHILSSFGGFLYIGGTYDLKGDRLILKNYPTYSVENANNREVYVINYSNETDNRYELIGDQLHLTQSGGTVIWTKAVSVIPTPTPTPTPPPPPEDTPTPPPDVEEIRVLYDGNPLRFGNEFSQAAGVVDNKFSVRLVPSSAEVDIIIVSDNEEIFTVEQVSLEWLPPNAFEVTAVSPGTANLIVTAGGIEERYIVRITEE